MPSRTPIAVLATLAATVTATVTATVLLAAPARASEICGDVNDSGNLSTSDALLVLRAAVGHDVDLVCEVPSESTFGHTTDFVTSDTFGPGFLLGNPIQIDAQATITHFGVIAKSSGQQVRFALYTSSGGNPQDLVIGSSPSTLTGGLQEIPVPATQVAAGTYWLLALYDEEATIGSDFSGETLVRYRAHEFGEPFPAQFGPPVGYAGDRFNYYVKVQL